MQNLQRRLNRQIFEKLLEDPEVLRTTRERTANSTEPDARPHFSQEGVDFGTPVWPTTTPVLGSRKAFRILEAVVRFAGRPVWRVIDDSVVATGLTNEWSQRAASALSSISPTIRSVGCIECAGTTTYHAIGSGFLVAPDVVVTNRHVAVIFAQRGRSSCRFRVQGSSHYRSRIDFARESESNSRPDALFDLSAPLYIARANEPDLALIKIDRRGAPVRNPVHLSDRLMPGQMIVVVGYPQRDNRTNRIAEVNRVFEGIYGVKRAAPGEVMQVGLCRGSAFAHDCSTLGGNSGSAVVSVDDGSVVGLHFAGAEFWQNHAINAAVILDRMDRLRIRLV